MGDGHSVRIQHCEVRKEDGNVCDAFLGVNYPTTWCSNHDVIFGLFIQDFMVGVVVDELSELVKPLIDILTEYAQHDPFKIATIREITRSK